MKKKVMLSIRGEQKYEGQEPDVIELVTEGALEYRDGGWDLSYEESDLTGLEGVTTTFRVKKDQITLTRTGKLSSQMVFRVGMFHESLYQMDFGALMITVCATRVEDTITEQGGTIDLTYGIDIAQSAVGIVTYHLDIQAKE